MHPVITVRLGAATIDQKQPATTMVETAMDIGSRQPLRMLRSEVVPQYILVASRT